MFPAQFTMITKTKSTIFLINFLVSNNTKWLLVSVVTKTLLLRVLKYQYYMKLHIRKTDLNNASNIVAMVFLFRKRGLVMKVSVNGLTLKCCT